MENISEREQRLLDIVKKLILALSISGMADTKIIEIMKWRNTGHDSIGLNLEWQDEALKFLEKEYELKYNKVDASGKFLEENDGNNSEERV